LTYMCPPLPHPHAACCGMTQAKTRKPSPRRFIFKDYLPIAKFCSIVFNSDKTSSTFCNRTGKTSDVCSWAPKVWVRCGQRPPAACRCPSRRGLPFPPTCSHDRYVSRINHLRVGPNHQPLYPRMDGCATAGGSRTPGRSPVGSTGNYQTGV